MDPKFSKYMRILVVILLLGSLAAPLAVVHSTGYTIIGTVIDEQGNKVEGATIKVYTKSSIVSGGNIVGEYVTTETSNEDGSFELSVERKAYTLKFLKAGYEENTFNVDLTSTTVFTNNLQNVTLARGVSLQTSPSMLVHDGETFTIPVTVTNNGDDETITIQVICGEGYKASVYNQKDQLVQSIYLPGGSSTLLSVKATAPLNATNSNLIIKLIGNLVTENTIQLKVIEAGDIALNCTYPGMDVYPSDSFSFTVTLNNPYYHTETFSLGVTTPSSWSLSVKNNQGEKINSVTLGAGETASLKVVGDVPSTSTSGKYSFTLKVSANGKSIELPLSVTINEVSAALTLTSKYSSQVISLGKTVVYPITIKNPGTKQLITFNVEDVPSGWKMLFLTSDNTQINSMLIDADSSESVKLQVTPSLSSSKTDYSFTVKVDGEYSSGEIELKTSIGGSYGLSMNVESLYEETSAGSAFTETIVLTNTGYSPLNNLALSLTYPNGWTVTASPLKVTTLESNSKTTFILTVTAPSGTAAQDYLVQVTAVSDEASTSQQSIRVTVNVESSWSIYGLALLLIAAGGFALLYKKLRRR
jgi:uncharacterized membrane protein